MHKILLTLTIVFLSFAGYTQSFQTERVAIKNGKHTLDGLLLIPPGSAEPMPVLIFFGGSGQWEIVDTYLTNPKESYANFLSFYFKRYLDNKQGAVLLLNKRGMGRSSGKYGKSSIEDRASDGTAAIDFLYNDLRFDKKKIFVVGHSQGGWVVQILSSDPRVAASISFAGPTVGVKQQTYTDYKNQFDCDYGKDTARSNKKLKRKKRELRVGAAIGKLIGGSAGEYARMSAYNHDPALRKISAPTLLLFGEKDILVPPHENINHLQQVFNNQVPNAITVWTGPNLNHAFYEVDSPCTGYMESLKGQQSTALQDYLDQWLNKVLGL